MYGAGESGDRASTGHFKVRVKVSLGDHGEPCVSRVDCDTHSHYKEATTKEAQEQIIAQGKTYPTQMFPQAGILPFHPPTAPPPQKGDHHISFFQLPKQVTIQTTTWFLHMTWSLLHGS